MNANEHLPAAPDWDRVRDEFEPLPGSAYLNTGSFGRTPRPVLHVATELRRRLAEEPCEMLWRHLHGSVAALSV